MHLADPQGHFVCSFLKVHYVLEHYHCLQHVLASTSCFGLFFFVVFFISAFCRAAWSVCSTLSSKLKLPWPPTGQAVQQADSFCFCCCSKDWFKLFSFGGPHDGREVFQSGRESDPASVQGLTVLPVCFRSTVAQFLKLRSLKTWAWKSVSAN